MNGAFEKIRLYDRLFLNQRMRDLKMSSSKDYLQYITEQLSDLEEISYRPMMGEYIIYYRGKIVDGIYDNRLLVKPVKSAVLHGAASNLTIIRTFIAMTRAVQNTMTVSFAAFWKKAMKLPITATDI